MKKELSIAILLLAFSTFVSAEWKYDQNAMNNCLCFQGCATLCGWACGMDVGCYYNPKPSDASPACMNTAGGPCICAGWGCGRCSMVATGKGWQSCQDSYAKPVCGDGKCENNKDESCSNCPKDCGCFSTSECTGKDPKDNRGCTDKCAGIECKSKCDGDTLSYGGKCDRGIKGCVYKTTKCKNGCDNASWGGAKCKPEDDKCKGVVCDGECDYGGMIHWEGECNKSSGQCVYSQNATCPKGCAGKDKCVGAVDGVIYYTDATKVPAGVKELMRQVKVKMRYIDKDGKMHEGKDRDDPEFYVWTDEYGRFSWKYADNFDPEGKISLALVFENQKKKEYLIPYADRTDRKKILGAYFEKNLPVTDPKLRSYDVDLTKSPLANNDGLKDAAKIYSNILKAAEYKEDAFHKGGTIEERVMLSEPGTGAWHLEEIYKDVQDDTGMSLKAGTMGFSNPEAPTNREFHEYGHHIMAEFQNMKYNPPGVDHAGYFANPNTEFALLEGWAEFCGLVMKWNYGSGSNGDYEVQNVVWNLEADYLIDDPAQPVTAEELAAAGVLWDLVDSAGPLGHADDDQVSMWPFEVYNVMSTKHDFNDGKGSRFVLTMRDLYLALVATGDRRLNDSVSGQNYTKLDQIFMNHNVYQDLNTDTAWQPGEPFGYSGHGNGAKRSDLEYEPGTEVRFDVKDQNGNQIPNLYAKVAVNYSTPYEYLSSVHVMPVIDGFVAVPMPPRKYNATIIISAVQGGTNNTGKDTFKTTTKEIYQKINPKKPLGTITTTIKTTPVPCKTDTECLYSYAGTKCSNKTNSCEGESGIKKAEKIECGTNLRCDDEKDSVLDSISVDNIKSKMPCIPAVGILPITLIGAITQFDRKRKPPKPAAKTKNHT